MSDHHPFLLAFQGQPPAGFAPALAALSGRVLLALPDHLIILAPQAARERLARLPGVTHAGGINLPQRPLPRLRVAPDGRPLPA
ncbi:MAG: hypothetical protein WCP77_08265 [Roseococcus sp.]